MHDNKSQWFIQVFCGVLTAFALFIPMPAMVFAEDEQQEYVQESGQDVPESELSEKVGEIHTEDYTEGWVLIDDKSHWQYADGTFAYNTWIEDNGKKYYLDENGELDPSMVWHDPGWRLNFEGWWWQNEDGSYPTSCFKDINNVTYYFDSDGYMTVGWLFLDGSWYYFSDSGNMVTNGWIYVKGNWYYLDSSGAMRTGWQKIDGQWYYLQESGAMCTGWLQNGNSWYYLESSGAMLTGWIQINSGWFYLSESGAMVIGWQKIGDYWYYFRESGLMAADTWIDSYYLTSSGAWDPSVAYDNIYTWPCPGYTRISSDYGPRPRPTAGASSYHRGIDISAPEGATVTSIHRGTVQSYGYNGTMGNYVKISHGNGVASVYMHMSRIANIHTGMSVSAGTTIGYVGSTGVATGAHLHLGILLNGNYVSPWNYISRP